MLNVIICYVGDNATYFIPKDCQLVHKLNTLILSLLVFWCRTYPYTCCFFKVYFETRLFTEPSQFRDCPEMDASDPSRKKIVSSAYWLILTSRLGATSIPFSMVNFSICSNNRKMAKLNRYPEAGSPCLMPLWRLICLPRQPLSRILELFCCLNISNEYLFYLRSEGHFIK